MIHVITRNQIPLYADQFDEMYRLLHRIFRTNRDWTIDARNGRVSDHSDPALAIYLMHLSENGHVNAAVRLTPSEFRPASSPQPYDQAMAALPAGPDTWDASQFCFSNAADKRQVLAELTSGMIEFSLTWGIGRLSALIDHDLTSALRLVPLPVSFTGPPVEIGGDLFSPVSLQVTPESLKSVHALTGAERPALHLAAASNEAQTAAGRA